MTQVETRPTRRLADDELSPWAIKRGEWNDDEDGLTIGTALFAALVGSGMWICAYLIARAAWTALVAIRFPEIGVF